MLLLMFASTAFTRTLYEAITVGLPKETLTVSAIAIPVVAVMTLFAQRFPPPFSAKSMRRLTFITLVIIGLGLMVGSFSGLW